MLWCHRGYESKSQFRSLDLIEMIGISISNSLFYEKARAEYEYRLNFDQVTGLRKRETFNNLGESYVEYDCSFMGVFASDIIRLSDINEKFGYMAGNARLKMVADVIGGVLQATIYTGTSRMR